jgi:hypothetical protein
MDNTEESALNNDSKNSTDGTSRSLTDRLPMRPIVAAGRLMSCLSKQPRNIISRRHHTISTGSSYEKFPFLKPFSKRISSTRHRSSSGSDSNSFNSTSSLTMHNSKTTPSDLNQMSKTILTSTASTIPTPDTVGFDFNFDSTYTQLRELADTNCKYFSQQKTDVCKRFEHLLIQLLNAIDSSIPLIRYLSDNFHHFDYSPEV